MYLFKGLLASWAHAKSQRPLSRARINGLVSVIVHRTDALYDYRIVGHNILANSCGELKLPIESQWARMRGMLPSLRSKGPLPCSADHHPSNKLELGEERPMRF
ncbi:hypothetical protein VNO77_03640 [Canavalia gladiata]|uniref:Uncharacterized protein n=1 Tax=Canavalia gladiata TaxID=3824 RepID=A0AAN9MV11_CANGL